MNEYRHNICRRRRNATILPHSEPKHDKDKNGRMGCTFGGRCERVSAHAEQALYMYLKYCDCTVAVRYAKATTLTRTAEEREREAFARQSVCKSFF